MPASRRGKENDCQIQSRDPIRSVALVPRAARSVNTSCILHSWQIPVIPGGAVSDRLRNHAEMIGGILLVGCAGHPADRGIGVSTAAGA